MSEPHPCCVYLSAELKKQLDRIGYPTPHEALVLADFCKTNIAKLTALLAGDDNDDSIVEEWKKIEYPIQDCLDEMKLIPKICRFC